MSAKGEVVDWLTRQDIDQILDSMSADALIEGMEDGKAKGASLMRNAFNVAASTAGYESNGRTPFQRVRVTDLKYVSERIGEAVNIESPLSEGTEGLLDSADSGE